MHDLPPVLSSLPSYLTKQLLHTLLRSWAAVPAANILVNFLLTCNILTCNVYNYVPFNYFHFKSSFGLPKQFAGSDFLDHLSMTWQGFSDKWNGIEYYLQCPVKWRFRDSSGTSLSLWNQNHLHDWLHVALVMLQNVQIRSGWFCQLGASWACRLPPQAFCIVGLLPKNKAAKPSFQHLDEAARLFPISAGWYNNVYCLDKAKWLKSFKRKLPRKTRFTALFYDPDMLHGENRQADTKSSKAVKGLLVVPQ